MPLETSPRGPWPAALRALVFVVAAAAAGAVAGRLVRAFWNARIARLPLEYPWSALDGILGDLQDALALCLGVLAVLALHAALVGREPVAGRPPAMHRLAREATLLVLLYAGALMYAPHGEGFAFWAGSALTALLSRVCLLAVQLCVRLPWREPLARVALYLVGRGSFVWAYVAGLALRGENALYALVPLGALVLEVLLVGLVLTLRLGRGRLAASRLPASRRKPGCETAGARVRPSGLSGTNPNSDSY